jgi:Regulator of chromosome condensation (RCC1) repeat
MVQGEDYRVLQLCFSPNLGAALIDESAADGESDIQLWTWGEKLLGHGPDVSRCKTPRRVDALRDHNVVQVDCGEHHSAALTDQGRIYLWGLNIHKELPEKPLLGVLDVCFWLLLLLLVVVVVLHTNALRVIVVCGLCFLLGVCFVFEIDFCLCIQLFSFFHPAVLVWCDSRLLIC